jgi:DNA-binding MarR family transcriptional regulator
MITSQPVRRYAGPVPEDPNRELLQSTSEFVAAFERWIASAAGEGLSYPRMRVLEALHCRGPEKLKSLADLEAEGLARRVDHPTDRRVTLLELTPAGLEAAECSLTPRLARLAAIFDSLTADERSQLTRAMRTLVAAIDETLRPDEVETAPSRQPA